MANMELGTIGRAIMEIEEKKIGAIAELQAIRSEALLFLTNWKKEYKAINRSRKQKEKYEGERSVLSTATNTTVAGGRNTAASRRDGADEAADEDTSTLPSRRPMRMARNVAINNIRKQTLLPLNRKIRRPDSDEVNEIHSVYNSKRTTAVDPHEKKKKVESEASTEQESEIFAKPTKPAKKTTEKRVEASSVREEVQTPVRTAASGVHSVKETIARFEELKKQNLEAKASSTPIKPARQNQKGEAKTTEKIAEGGKDMTQNGTEYDVAGKDSTKESHEADGEEKIGLDLNGGGVDSGTVARGSSAEANKTMTLPSAESAQNLSAAPVERLTRNNVAEQTKKSLETPEVAPVQFRHTRSGSRSTAVVPSPAISPVPYLPGARSIIDESLDESTINFEKRKDSEEENDKNVSNCIGNVVPPKTKRRKPQKGAVLSSTIFDETLDGKKKSPEAGLHDKTVESKVCINNEKAESFVWELSEGAPSEEADGSPQRKTKRTKARKAKKATTEGTDVVTCTDSAGGGACEVIPSRIGAEADENVEAAEKQVRDTKTKRTKARKGKRTANNSIMSNASQSSAETSWLVADGGETTFNKTPQNINNGTFVVTQLNGNLSDSEPMDEIFGSGLETVRAKKPKRNANTSTNLEGVDPVSRGSFEKSMDTIEFHVPRPVASKRTKVVANSKHFDAAGNPILREVTSTRTKTLTAPTIQDLPEVGTVAGEGRPVRVRTKVRRLGVEEGVGDAEEQRSTHSEESMGSQRTTRTKTKALQKAAENEYLKVVKAIKRDSKGKRASLIINARLLSKIQDSSANRGKTPLSTVTNKLGLKRPMIIVNSATKEHPLTNKKKRFVETKIVSKPADEQLMEEREAKLKTKQQKEELAAQKKMEEINRKRELLKQKNEEKLDRAMKCRAKLEEQKHEQVVQTEKEKELKRKLLLQERELKQKADLSKKRMITEKKLTEAEERRRAEEEARLAKIREMELEQQRQLQEKQRQLEHEEKRARERLEEKRKMMEAEKLMKQKIAQAKVEAEKSMHKVFPVYKGKYLPRNENDLGLEDEHSEDSDGEAPPTPDRAAPKWVNDLKKGDPCTKYLTLKQLAVFMPLVSKSPDVHRMFNMSPRRILRRTSSAIWNNSMSSPF